MTCFKHGSAAADASWAAAEAIQRAYLTSLGHSTDEIECRIAERAVQSTANVAEQDATARHRNVRRRARRWAKGTR